jgi:hemerythrin
MLRTPTVATVQYADVKKVCRAKKLLEYKWLFPHISSSDIRATSWRYSRVQYVEL